MIFTQREIEVLRLLCWCRFIRPNYLSVLMMPSEFHNLTALGYIKCHEKSGYFAPTSKCHTLIDNLFPDGVPELSRTYRKSLIQRRANTSSIALTAYRAGADVFLSTAEKLTATPALFMTAFARTEKANPWGSTRVAALSHLGDTFYAIHYVCPGIGKMALTDELTAFNNQTAQFHGIQRAMIFAGESYSDVLSELEADHPRRDTKLVYYGDAYRQALWPIHILSCDSTGAMQMKIMAIPNYRARFAKAILDRVYMEPPEDVSQWDGFYQGLPLVVAVDMDLRRIDAALELALEQGHPKIAIACLRGSQYRLLKTRYDNAGKAEVYQITDEALFAVLSTGLELYAPASTQYLTEKGDVVHAPLIQNH